MSPFSFCFTALLSLFFLTSACPAAEATPVEEKLPLYEYGVVGIAGRLPHYRGFDEYSSYAFPLPYFIYRGKIIKANRDGVRGILLA